LGKGEGEVLQGELERKREEVVMVVALAVDEEGSLTKKEYVVYVMRGWVDEVKESKAEMRWVVWEGV
jgi:hypothetical protein